MKFPVLSKSAHVPIFLRKIWYLITLTAQICMGNTLVVTTAEDQLDTPSGAELSLREAIRDAGQQSATICFDPSFSGQSIGLRDTRGLGTLRISSPADSPGGTITIDASNLPERLTLFFRSLTSRFGTIITENRNLTLRNVNVIREGNGGQALGHIGGVLRLEDVSLESRGGGSSLGISSASAVLNGCEMSRGTGVFMTNMESVVMTDTSIYHQTGPALLLSPGPNPGAVNFTNCTFAENYRRLRPSTIASVQIEAPFASQSFSHCSFVDNLAAGLSCPASTNLSHCLFARNRNVNGDLVSIASGTGLGANSLGYNLADDAPAGLNSSTDIVQTDARVSRISEFGGERKVCFPFAGSPAIDGGNPNRSALVPGADARGFFRNASSFFATNSNPIDIGAVETNPNGTLVVTSNADSGPGTLRSVIDQALADENANTHHIIFDDSLSDTRLFLQSSLFVEDNHNLNIDGTGLAEPLRVTGSLNAPLFNFSSAPGDFFISGSLSGLIIEDFSVPNQSGPARAVITMTGGTQMGVQKMQIRDCNPTGFGALDVFDNARVSIDECVFSGNRQLDAGTGVNVNKGGSAITVRRASLECWNSTFLANVALSPDMDGGAVFISETRDVSFRATTFSANRATRFGGAIAFEDDGMNGLLFFSGGLLDYCTFVRNTAAEGAISAFGFTPVIVQGCLFSGNQNTTANTASSQDLYSGGSGARINGLRLSWTDAPEVERTVALVNLPSRLAPTADYGGCVPTSPFLVGGVPFVSGRVEHFLVRDALRGPGLDDVNFIIDAVAGAVQRQVTSDSVLRFANIETTDTTYNFEVIGIEGIPWRLQTSTNLIDWDTTNTTFRGGTVLVRFPLPTPRPDTFFVRYIEVR